MSNSTKLLNYGTIGYFTHSVNRKHQIGNRKRHPVIVIILTIQFEVSIKYNKVTSQWNVVFYLGCGSMSPYLKYDKSHDNRCESTLPSKMPYKVLHRCETSTYDSTRELEIPRRSSEDTLPNLLYDFVNSRNQT
jgi:hypothetical protein